MKVFLTIIVCILLVFGGFSLGMHVSYLLLKPEISQQKTHQHESGSDAKDMINVIYRLTDAVDSLRVSQEQESNETQAIWREIQERHYSPY